MLRRRLLLTGLAAVAIPAKTFAVDSNAGDFDLVHDGKITNASASPGSIPTIVDHHGSSFCMNGDLLNLPEAGFVRVVLRDPAQSFSEIEVTPVQVKDYPMWSRSFAKAGINVSRPAEKNVILLAAPLDWRIVSVTLAKNDQISRGTRGRQAAIDIRMERYKFPDIQP